MRISRRIRLQGILYSAALASLCFAFILLVTLNVLNYSYVLEFLCSILQPLQGFWNALIYMIPLLFQQFAKKICKSQQNVNNSTQNNQNTSSKASWLTRLSRFWIQTRTSKESKKGSSKNQKVEVQDESKKEEEDLEGGNNRAGVLKVKKKQEEQILPVNASSELKSRRKVVIFKENKGEYSNAAAPSSLMISCVEEQEEADGPLSFELSQNSELGNGEQSQLEYFSALEVNTEGCDNVDDEDDKYIDDESYVDDYLRMMENGW